MFLPASVLGCGSMDEIEKCNLKENINEAFKVRGAQILSLNRQGVAYWSVGPTYGFYFSIDKLVEMLEYLIYNIYIVVGNRVFQQHIGITMGTDYAPLLENLYLFYYEYNYMKNLMKLDYAKTLILQLGTLMIS